MFLKPADLGDGGCFYDKDTGEKEKMRRMLQEPLFLDGKEGGVILLHLDKKV